MNMIFNRELFSPQEMKDMYPLSDAGITAKAENDMIIKDILSGKSDKMILVIGPCSADREDSVMEYICRLRAVQEKVKDRFHIVPRIYTNKPRTTGDGYKGMLHQPNPQLGPDLFKGLIAIRKLHLKVMTETGFSCADEMLYPESYVFLSDLLSYVAVGARSVENQQHRLVASGLDVPVGMKNPTGGDISVMLNSIKAAQGHHSFIYRNWEVETMGNPFSHAILRGYVDTEGRHHPNYHFDDLLFLASVYSSKGLVNPAVVVDCNHSNSGKNYMEQGPIAKDVLKSMGMDNSIRSLVKGFMIESYLEDGCQASGENVYGKSITDPCLGWEKTECLIYELAEL